MLQKIVKYIFTHPLVKNIPDSEKGRVILLYFSSILGFLATVGAVFILMPNDTTGQIIQLSFSSLYLFFPFLAISKYSGKIKIAFFLIVCIHHFILANYFGEAAGYQYIYLPLYICPFILFDTKDVLIITGLLSFNFLCLFTLDFTDYSLINFGKPEEESVMKIATSLPFIINFCALLFAIAFSLINFLSDKSFLEKTQTLEIEFEEVFNNSNDALFITEPYNSRILKCNKRAVELFALQSEQDFIDNFGINFHKLPYTNEIDKLFLDSMEKYNQFDYEFEYISADKREWWGNIAIKRYNTQKKESFNLVRITDISKIKKAENDLKKLLTDKDVLLAEIHHRVKNNMAIISGLVYLQSLKIEDETLRSHFIDTQNRIKSMAIVHEKLYKTQSFEAVNFKEYLKDLVTNLENLFSSADTKIGIEIQCDDISLKMDYAIPCALIVNELISNAIKHAFKNKNNGHIVVDFFIDSNNYVLKVQDNGLGIDKDILKQKTNTLGLSLISNLVSQLNGNIDIVNDNGSLFLISFAK
jgi:PAS domain S-box-containing protein